MKKVFKSLLFVIILIVLVQAVSLLFMPNISNLPQFGFYKKARYELLDETNDTIDTVFIGDSLIYSSIIPMHIWNEYGFTTFDCSLSAQTIDDMYKYLKVAIESQHPKIVFIGSDVLFRPIHSRAKTKRSFKALKNIAPILKFHNNWKRLFDGKYINVYKGYKLNIKSVSLKNGINIKPNNEYESINENNIDYFEKIVDLCDANNIKMILLDIPNNKHFSFSRHNTIEKISKELGVPFLDLNLIDINIDWSKDTKDGGEHLNFNGAKKVSSYIGDYLNKLNILEDHRNDLKYKDWHKAYKIYIEKTS